MADNNQLGVMNLALATSAVHVFNAEEFFSSLSHSGYDRWRNIHMMPCKVGSLVQVAQMDLQIQ